jgi:Dimerisation domain
MRTKPAPGDSLRMTQLLFGFTTSQALYVTARLGVATALLDRPRRLEELAESTGADRDALGRVIRTLASLGVFRTEEDGNIAVTPLGSTLAAGVPGSTHGIAIFLMETHYEPFGKLLGTAQTGETPRGAGHALHRRGRLPLQPL